MGDCKFEIWRIATMIGRREDRFDIFVIFIFNLAPVFRE